MEIWKDVKGFEGVYMISTLGRIKSVSRYVRCGGGVRSVKGRILNPTTNSNGYKLITIRNKTYYIHHLMAMTFLGHESKKGLVIDHINNNRLDNRLENLKVITHRENTSKDRSGLSEYTGVKVRSNNRYESHIRIDGRSIYLGTFKCELAAAKAYNDKLNELING